MPRTTSPSTTSTKGIVDVAELPAGQLARRRRIVAVASQLLEDEELADIQMRVVAENAGVALGTLYRYFGSKDHLYAAVLLEWIDSFTTRSANGAKTPSERVRARMHQAVRAFEKRPRFYRAQYLLQRSEDATATVLFDEFSARNIDVIVRDLGDVPRQLAEDRAHIIMATLNTAVALHCMKGEPVDVSYRLMDTCVDLLVGPLDDAG